MANFEIPDFLSYSPQTPTIDNSVNFVQFKPISGSTFGPSDSIKFKITSNNAFIRPSKCFLRYKIQLTGGTAHASGTQTTAGYAAGVISRVETIVSGLRVEDIDEYGLMCAKLYQKSTTEYQNTLKALEGFADGANAKMNSTAPRGVRTVCHALRTALFESNQDIPLCFLRGGIELNLFTNVFAALNLTAGTTPPTSYQITDVSMVIATVKVPDSYLSSFQNSLEKGNTAKIPLKITRHISNQLVAASENHVQLNVGFLKSLDSITGIIRKAAEINADTKDTFGLNCRDGLESFYISNGSDRIPRDHTIGCALVSADVVDPTALMYELISIDNSYQHLNTGAGYSTTTDFEINHCFTPHFSSHGQGLTISDGSIVEHLNFAASLPTALSRVDWFLLYSAMLSVNNDGVSLNTSDF